jgi:hypothetical protein
VRAAPTASPTENLPEAASAPKEPAVRVMPSSPTANSPKEQPPKPGKKKADPLTDDGHLILTNSIVMQSFVDKRGKAIDERKEFYVRRSMADYFIKFCESGITTEDLRARFGDSEEVTGLAYEAEIRSGDWDSCGEVPTRQSRVGQYIVIFRLR